MASSALERILERVPAPLLARLGSAPALYEPLVAAHAREPKVNHGSGESAALARIANKPEW